MTPTAVACAPLELEEVRQDERIQIMRSKRGRKYDVEAGGQKASSK